MKKILCAERRIGAVCILFLILSFAWILFSASDLIFTLTEDIGLSGKIRNYIFGASGETSSLKTDEETDDRVLYIFSN